jgi:hypothetical protein
MITRPVWWVKRFFRKEPFETFSQVQWKTEIYETGRITTFRTAATAPRPSRAASLLLRGRAPYSTSAPSSAAPQVVVEHALAQPQALGPGRGSAAWAG